MYVRALSETGRAEAALVGGKAANLGELARLGMPVPPGFAVTTRAYSEQAARCGLAGALAPLLAREDWEGAEEAAVALLGGRPIEESLRSAVLAAYHAMGSPAVAVRSSATAEDLAAASFAGQYDTFLNVRGDEELLRAVAMCWASLWNRRAARYRRQHSVSHAAAQMAVVVQEMVRAEASGVVFTVDPVSRRRDKMLVEMAPGAGEALVSGAIANPESTAPAPELRRLALAIEKHFGCPQDIEFARGARGFHILQARPITTLGEALPEPLPPLGKPSFIDRAMQPIAAERYASAPRPLDNLTYTRTVGATIYAVRQAGAAIAAGDEAAFRAQIWRQAYRLPPVRLGWRALFSRLTSVRLLSRDWGAWWEREAAPALRAACAPAALDALTSRDLFARAESILAAWEGPLNRRFYAASAIQAGWWLRLLVALAVPRSQRARVAADLMAGLATPTNEINDALWEISRLARRGGDVPAAVDRFLETWGHREGAVFYLSAPVWRRDPAPVWQLVGALAEVESRPAEDGMARYQAALALAGRRLRRFPWLHRLFLGAVERFRAFDAFRERSHLDLTLPLAALQDVAAEWARRLVARGTLRAAEDIFYLTYDEVRAALLDGAPPDTGELLARRRATWMLANARWQAAKGEAQARGGELRGIGVSPGVARGPARRIEGEHQFGRLRPGEIVVCPHSNPAWTPLFIAAAAVVSETGGAASHAAIVAREYGIPAVMSVRGALRAIADGEELVVDGESGRVLPQCTTAQEKDPCPAPK